MWETQVQSLSWDDPLEKEMATHSSILAWKIPWMEQPGGLQSMGSQGVRHDQVHVCAEDSLWGHSPPTGIEPRPSAVKGWGPNH